MFAMRVNSINLELLIDVCTHPAGGKTPTTLCVRFNDVGGGQWRLPRQTRNWRRRNIIPKEAFNRNSIGRLIFKSAGENRWATQFGLEGVEMRDVRRLISFNGHVDHCTTKKIVGWAAAGDSAVDVMGTINGKPVKSTFVNVERPDLPVADGFKLNRGQPILAGSTINVLFANGRPLNGSPCQAD